MTFRRRFAPELWERLVALGRPERLSAGSVLVRRGDPPAALWILLSGEVEILDPRTAPPTILGTVGSGEPIGDLSFLLGRTATADVHVVLRAQTLRLDREALHEALEADPELSAAFHKALSSTLAGRLSGVTSNAMAGAFASRSDTLTDVDEDDVNPDDAYLSAATAWTGPRSWSMQGKARLTLGRSPSCDVVLADPRVAAVHAELLQVDEQGWRIVASPVRPVLVDGDWTVSAPIREGMVLGLGRARLRVQADGLQELDRPPLFALHVDGVSRKIAGRTILKDVSFSVLSGEVIAMIGPSGAGKSTLIHVMSGVSKAHGGQVYLDDEPIWDVLRRHPTTTAEVPQDDIVLPELSVEESLLFATRLRAPQHTGEDRRRVVNEVLADLGLDDVRSSRIGDPERRGISGGQRKRVNIGQELVSEDTKVIFLDEPTSGLDPRSTVEIARLARNLADAGRVVILVTHDLDPALFAEVDHVLVLSRGGRLAFFGPVEACCEAFGVDVPSRIFDRLPDRDPDDWAAWYAASKTARTFSHRRHAVPHDPAVLSGVAPSPGWWRQLNVLVRRVAEVKRRDPTSTSVLVLQPLVVGTVMLLVFPHGTSGLLFLLVLSCFWFGMSAAVRELIVDQVVWARERRIGLYASAWVLSKVVVIGSVVAIQASLLSIAAHLGVGMGGLGFSLPALAGTAVLTGWVGVGTGMLVSAAWRRSEAAVGTIVLWLVPQITFSGLLMPLSDVSPVAYALSWATPVRYAFHLALMTGDQLEYLKLGTWHPRPIHGELFLLGLRPAGEGTSLPAWALVGILLGLVVVQIAATIALVRRRR